MQKDCVACGGWHFSDEGISVCKFLHWLGGHYEATKEEVEGWLKEIEEIRSGVRSRKVPRPGFPILTEKFETLVTPNEPRGLIFYVDIGGGFET